MNQQIKYRNRYNSPKGITIVALVVTIVIMLILVGVTVTIAINGGLIGTAKDSKEETRYTQVLAEKEMWESEKRSTDRFGIQVETLEEFVNRLKDNKLLTEKEAEQAKQNLKVTIAKKIIYLSKDKVVANSGLWEATIDKKTQQAILTKYKGTGELLKDVVVPNAIEKDGIEYEVIQIGNGNKVAEFEGEITISEGITTVGQNAFYCKGITKVNLPTSLKQIQYQAFRGTTNLKSISLPKGLEVLGNRAFNASGITSIVIPGTVKTVEVNAFFQSYIEQATIEDGVEILDSAAFRQCGLKEITIPGSVKEIKDSCFSEIWGLSKVTINNGVEKIDGGAFYGTAIKEIEIPASVLTIDDSAFSGCGMIQTINVAIDNQNYSSQNDSLYNKDKTKIIRYPSGKEDTEFEVPSTVKEIGNSCFSSCGNLETIQITSNVEKLATSSFVNQGKLTEINVVGEKNQYYSSEDGVLFNKDKTEFIKWPQGKSLKEYTVPGTVKTIKGGSFYVSNIKSIIIPPSVEKVESYAFQSTRATKIVCQEQDGKGVKEIGYRCFYLSNLIEISLPSTLEKLDGEAFRGSDYLKKITINKPENSLSGKPWNASASVIIEWTGE